MKRSKRILLSAISLITYGGIFVSSASADTLYDQQTQLGQLHNESALNEQDIANQTKQAQSIQSNIDSYQKLIDSLNNQISSNKQQIDKTQAQLDQINIKLDAMNQQLDEANNEMAGLLTILYEKGYISYLAVLFKATSFNDLLSRAYYLSVLTKKQHDLGNQILALNANVIKESKEQNATYRALVVKKEQLQSLQNVDSSIQQTQKLILFQTNQRIQADRSRQTVFSQKIQLTEDQIQQILTQVREQQDILAINVPNIPESDLNYKNYPPDALYQYVKAHNSTFSFQDIETICEAGKRFNVNPALLIAVTGQEQSFVPPSTDAKLIRNNPFNVFYSWVVYNTNLQDAANIAANTLRHKLSTPPPAGENPIIWANDPKNPWGVYAEDSHWAYGVLQIYDDINSTLGVNPQ